jgi:hypothetical protein
MSRDLNIEGRPIGIALDEVGRAASHRFWGRNGATGLAFTPVWNVGTAYPWPAAAAKLDIVSNDADDDDGDTGARTVYVAGLDASYAEIDETVTMNGLSIVTTVKSFLRVRKLSVLTAGTTGTNEGTITASLTGTANVVAAILPLEGHSSQALITAPAAKSLLVYDPVISFPNYTTVRLRVREFGGVWQVRGLWDSLIFQGNPGMGTIPRYFPAKTDVVFEALAAAGTATSVEALAVFVED